jgi:NAD(P)-dependent dehydrogenase (short-subunit alcohol dehydrogenase family)
VALGIDLGGRLALVTGSTQGIGQAIATRLAEAGAAVVVNGRDGSRVDAAVAQIRDAVPDATVRGVAADLADAASTGDLLAELPSVDILVNNLGIFEARPALEIDDAEWRRYFVAKGTGVTVNSVVAGPTHTAGVEAFVEQLVGSDPPWDEAQRAFMREHRPQSLLERLIEPTEIANVVAYLSSDLASATTGGAVRSDGGYVDSILP